MQVVNVAETPLLIGEEREWKGVMSRFESTLAAKIAGESNEQRHWASRLRLAAYRARKGELASAKNDISEARSRFAGGASAQITAYMNFAEGICEYFENGAAAALPKLNRAKILSVGYPFGDDLHALVSAWLAATYRVLGQWEKMSAELVDVFPEEQQISAETRARASIVLADAWHEVFDYSRADIWYKGARNHALECGDDVAIGAMLYNRAAIRVFNMRIQEVLGHDTDTDACSLAIEAASAENYSQYTHDVSMRWVFELLKGQVLMLKRQYQQALELLDSAKIQGLEKDWPAVEFLRLTDVLRCKASIGLRSGDVVLNDSNELEQRFTGRVGAGDLAVGRWSLYSALTATASASSKDFSDRSTESVEEFMVQRNQESTALAAFLSLVSSRSSFIATK